MSKTPTQIKSLARAHTETAINTLAGIMQQESSGAPARVAAATALLDRGWGKPTQPVAGDDDHDALSLKIIERVIVRPNHGTDSDSGSVPPAA